MAFDPTIRIQHDDFDIQSEINAMTDNNSDIGAVVTFSGLCRDEHGTLAALELEHYPGMAESEIRRIAADASDRWPLNGLTIIHRYGKILPGENIVLVVAASRHRQAAFESAHYLMDFMKSNAPFWKREIRRDGQSGDWVDAKETDTNSMKRWQAPEASA